MTFALPTFPLPVTWRLMLPTGTPFVGDLVLLAPGREVGQKASVGVGGIDTEVTTNVLEVDGIDPGHRAQGPVEPAFEMKEVHATTLVAVVSELRRTSGDEGVGRA